MLTYPYAVYVFGRFLTHLVLTEQEADEVATGLKSFIDHKYRWIDWA